MKSNAGSTLVEALFAAVIGAAIMGMVMILQVGAQHNMVMGLSAAEINSDARLAMDRIVRDVRWATQLETVRTIGGTTYLTGDDELILKIPAVDVSGDIIDDEFDYVVYTLDTTDPSRLRKIIDPDSDSSRDSMNQIIAKNISSFSLSSLGTGLSSVGSFSAVDAIEVNVSVNKTPLTGKTVAESLTNEIAIRNNE